MAYISDIVLLILLFVVLHRFTEISLQQKIGVVSILAVLVFSAYWFNQVSEKRRLHLHLGQRAGDGTLPPRLEWSLEGKLLHGTVRIVACSVHHAVAREGAGGPCFQ